MNREKKIAEEMLTIVSKITKCKSRDIVGESRHKRIVEARYLYFKSLFLLYIPVEEIAKITAKKEKSVWYGIVQISDILHQDGNENWGKIKLEVETLKRKYDL